MPLFSRDVGIDLGTSNTLMYIKDRGIVVDEASVVAYDINQKKVVRVGNDAKEMIGRTPPYIDVINPLKDGVIADSRMAEYMLKTFMDRVFRHHGLIGPRIAVCVPAEATEVEKRAVEDVALSCGARQAIVIDEPLAVAKGIGLDINSPDANMIVDIGGGTTEVSVISLGAIATGGAIRTAGDTMDNAIINYIRKNYSLLIGQPTAAEIKCTIGSATAYDGEAPMVFKGRDLISGLPKTMSISPEQIREALSEHLNAILECIRRVLEKTPPELTGDITANGIYITGGGGLLKGMDEYLTSEIGTKVTVATNALTCAAEGIGALLKENRELKEFGKRSSK
ncbi:MAG: rod shape-determining protein [Bacillota bacterium]|nr:rod shape-determining protein [Bacillota bacterium]